MTTTNVTNEHQKRVPINPNIKLKYNIRAVIEKMGPVAQKNAVRLISKQLDISESTFRRWMDIPIDSDHSIPEEYFFLLGLILLDRSENSEIQDLRNYTPATKSWERFSQLLLSK